jgi:N-acetylglucosaminyl-diphospho-decaprenol L-rhamnosyltransferase
MPGYFYASRTRFFYQAHGRGGLMLANVLWHLGRALTQLRRLAGKPVSAAVRMRRATSGSISFNPLGPAFGAP